MTISNIIAEARALVDATATSYPGTADTDILIRRINSAYEEIVGKLIARNNNFKFDDTNFTDTPIGYGNLQDGIQDYSYDLSMLTIDRIEVCDSSGIWHKLKRIDERDIEVGLDEYKKTNGLPEEYAERGNSIFLYPTPSASSVTLTNGIKFYFQRTASIFTTAEVSTGTKQPGFSSPYHILLAYKAALPYALTYKKDRVNMIMSEIQRMENELLSLSANRYKDQLSRLIPSNANNK